MPLKRNEAGEAIGTECVNKCGDLKRLDQKISVLDRDTPAENQPMTILVCPICQYCEWYYGKQGEE